MKVQRETLTADYGEHTDIFFSSIRVDPHKFAVAELPFPIRVDPCNSAAAVFLPQSSVILSEPALILGRRVEGPLIPNHTVYAA